MPRLKNDPAAGTDFRKEQTDSTKKTGRGTGNRILRQNPAFLNKRKKNQPRFSDSSFDHVEVTLGKLESPPNQFWLLDFLEIMKIPFDLEKQKAKLYKTLKMFTGLPGFQLFKKDSLIDVVKKCYDMMSADHKIIWEKEEVVRAELNFDTETQLVEISIGDIERIAQTDKKLSYALMMFLRYVISEKEYAIKYIYELGWNLEYLVESLTEVEQEEIEEGNADHYLESYHELHSVQNFVQRTCDHNLRYRRNQFLEKLVEKGFFRRYGIHDKVVTILNTSPLPSPYRRNPFNHEIYELSGENPEDDNDFQNPLEWYDLFFVSKDNPLDRSNPVIESIDGRVNEYGTFEYYNVYGKESFFENNSLSLIYESYAKIEEFILSHEANKNHYDLQQQNKQQ